MLWQFLAQIFAIVAGVQGWPWWLVAIAGAVGGFQFQNVRLYNSAWRDEIEAVKDPAVGRMYLGMLLWGAVWGVAICSAIYYTTLYLLK